MQTAASHTQPSSLATASQQRVPALADTLRSRRQRLARIIDFPVLFWSGVAKPRNFAANIYPYRASSHFLYFAGLPLENAAIRLEGQQLTLFMDDPTPDDTLWHGVGPSRDEIAEQIGATEAQPLSGLAELAAGTATLSEKDETIQMLEQAMLQRGIVLPRRRPRGNHTLEKALVRAAHDSR